MSCRRPSVPLGKKQDFVDHVTRTVALDLKAEWIFIVDNLNTHISESLVRFVYTPKRASWLNQIELWFSILARRLLRRASFVSVQDLSHRIHAFIKYFNNTMAKPFKWTSRGRPLAI